MTVDVSGQQQGEDGGGRRARRGRRGGGAGPRAIEQPPFRQARLVYPPTPAVTEEALERIHEASLTILEEIGIDFLNDEALQILRDGGADVAPDGNRVRIDRGLVDWAIAQAPSGFTLHARDPAKSLRFEAGWIAFGSVASTPNCSDMEGGRRPGTRHDFQNFIRLGQMLNAVQLWPGYPVEPADIHAGVRHLDAIFDLLTLSDKAIHAYSLGRERNLDALEMARIARGIDAATLDREPSIFTIINSSSPLRLDGPMLQGVIEYARRNQPVFVTPFTLAGAMAPVTVTGAVAQQNAEALAGLVFTQLVRPGAPFGYGGFTSNVDMKSGAPAFGTPEAMKAALLGGQLARRYGVPYRSSNVNAANTVDAQAAYESVFSLWGAVQGGANLIMHGAGWLEGGLQASFEKMVLDADLIGMVMEFLTPLETNAETLALDAVREVGPGGHFFGCAHTQERYKSAFFSPMISDWRNYESWQEAGRPEAYAKANRLYKQLLESYEPPAMDSAIREELEAFVAKRKEEGGAPTDF